MPRKKSVSAEERYYTIKAAADRVGVHPTTIRREIKAGHLAAANIRGAIRIRKSVLDTYLLESEQGQ